MGVLVLIVIGIGTYALYVISSLTNNVYRARRSGLPVLVHPMHCTNPLYLVTMAFWRPIIQRLPFGLSQWKYLHFFYMDWAFHTQDAQFEEYGDMFIIATPGGNILFVGDADVSHQVLARRVDFPKDIKFYCKCSNPFHGIVISNLTLSSVDSPIRRLGCYSMCFFVLLLPLSLPRR